MKSKLTLRLDEDLKEQAKRLAEKRGVSVSRLVEDYFRLLHGQAGGEDRSSEDSDLSQITGGRTDPEETLTPRIQDLKEHLGSPAPEVEMDEDTKRWVDAAAEKHQ